MKIYKSFDIPPLSDEIEEYEKEKKEDFGETKNGLDSAAAVHFRDRHTKIEGTFDPARELRAIRTSADPQQALEEYHSKLSLQKKGIASLYEKIISLVRHNPDITENQFDELMQPFETMYGLTADQIAETRRVVGDYSEKHKAVHATREKYPDDAELFAFLFARAPVGRVEIVEGPLTLYVRCQDQRDYAYIYSQMFLYGRAPTEQNIVAANKTGGVSLGSAIQPELRGCIIAENVPRSSGNETHIHEEQHAIRRLFSTGAEIATNYSDIFLAKNEKELQTRIEREFRAIRRTYEPQTADEILAYMKTIPVATFDNAIKLSIIDNGTGIEADDLPASMSSATEHVQRVLMLPKEKGGLYDYFRYDKNRLINRLLRDLGDEKDNLIREAAERVFVIEYRELIQQAIRVFGTLLQRGLSAERTIGLLIHEPLQKWSKVFERLYEYA